MVSFANVNQSNNAEWPLLWRRLEFGENSFVGETEHWQNATQHICRTYKKSPKIPSSCQLLKRAITYSFSSQQFTALPSSKQTVARQLTTDSQRLKSSGQNAIKSQAKASSTVQDTCHFVCLDTMKLTVLGRQRSEKAKIPDNGKIMFTNYGNMLTFSWLARASVHYVYWHIL